MYQRMIILTLSNDCELYMIAFKLLVSDKNYWHNVKVVTSVALKIVTWSYNYLQIIIPKYQSWF